MTNAGRARQASAESFRAPKSTLFWWLAVLVSTTALVNAHGQGKTLGYIYGQVTSSSGPVSGARVNAWHPDTARVRTAVTGVDGRYRFSALAVGRYAVSAALGGLQSDIVPAEVNVGEGTSVELLLESPRAVEEIVVIGESVSPLDVTSAETARIVTSEDIRRLPIPRDQNAVVLMAPGAVQGDLSFGTAGNRQHYGTGSAYASLGGASVAENVYYINGMNVTNFRRGLGASTIPFEFYDQFQIKTGGYGAEFGRATGGVVNAVTKRGTNEWRFALGGFFQPDSLRGDVPNVEHPSPRITYDSADGFDERDDLSTFVSAAGPVITDRLFVYGIHEFRDVEVNDYTAWGRLYQEADDDGFWGIKLDALISDNHRVEYTGFSDERTVRRRTYAWDASTDTIGEQVNQTAIGRGGDNHIVTYRGYFGTGLAATLLWGSSEYDLTSRSPGDERCPIAVDYRTGYQEIGCWTNYYRGAAYDEREVLRADIEWAVGDNHLLRFGVDREENATFDSLGYSGDGYFQYRTVMPGDELPNDGIVPDGISEVTRYRRYSRAGNFEVLATAYYIEDEWTITPLNATLRLGLRNERFDNRNAEGQSIVKITDQYAPRIGFSWDIGGDRTSKVFANYGRYHLPITSIVNVFLGSARSGTEQWYVLDQPIAEDGSTRFGQQIGETVVFADGVAPDVRTLVDQDIEPMAQDEFILGYERIVSDYIFGVSLTWRDLAQGIEDIAIDEAVGDFRGYNYVLVNPGRDVRTYFDLDGDGAVEEINLSAEELGFQSMKRRYRALNLDVQRRWDGVFYARASYTLSKSDGNYEGRVRSDTGEDLAGLTTQFDFRGLLDGANGDLPNDRRHQLKVWGAWEFTDAWQASAALHFASGRPKNAFGYHPDDRYAGLYGRLSFYHNGELVPRGSLGTTENVYRLDVGLKYTADEFLGGTLTVRLDVFNVLDLDSEIEVDEWADSWGGRGTSPTFGFPTRFQQPRTVRLGLRYEI